MGPRAMTGEPSPDTIFRVLIPLRYLSLAFFSALYLASPLSRGASYKLVVLAVLTALALYLIKAYPRHRDNVQAIKGLVLLECFSITALMLLTGGLDSPFVWYFLNPLVIAVIYLPLLYGWAFLGIFLAWGLVPELYLLQEAAYLFPPLRARLDEVLILGLSTLVMQVFARLYHALEEKSKQLALQQEELVGSFIKLSESHHVMQALSEFQRSVVSFKREEDIFKKLISACSFVFSLEEAAVLHLEEPLYPDSRAPFGRYRLILDSSAAASASLDQAIVDKVRERQQEFFSTRGFIMGAQGRWIAMPLKLEKKKVAAVFLGKIKPDCNLVKLPGDLYLFIQFAEQVIQSGQSLRQAEETLYQLSSLYEAVETISGRESPRETMDLFSAYARRLTGCEQAIFWMDQAGEGKGDEQFHSIYSVKGKSDTLPEESWQGPLLQAWSEIREYHLPLVLELEDREGKVIGNMFCVPVKSRSRCFGVLAAIQSRMRYNTEEILQKLSFLSELSAITIERNIAERFSDKLLVLEEQKRIANEIHDSISQNLFSIVYGLQSAVKRVDGALPELKAQLAEIQEVAARTAKELRVLIYRLSPRHRGDETFITELRSYLEGLSHINNIVIDFNAEGSEEFLNPSIRKAFYRIIREATGNAIRHGRCSRIDISLEMSPFASNLVVRDNGAGFDPALINTGVEMGGLGIINMREMIRSLQGNFSMRSAPGEGTAVYCSVPTSPVSAGKAVSR